MTNETLDLSVAETRVSEWIEFENSLKCQAVALCNALDGIGVRVDMAANFKLIASLTRPTGSPDHFHVRYKSLTPALAFYSYEKTSQWCDFLCLLFSTESDSDVVEDVYSEELSRIGYEHDKRNDYLTWA